MITIEVEKIDEQIKTINEEIASLKPTAFNELKMEALTTKIDVFELNKCLKKIK